MVTSVVVSENFKVTNACMLKVLTMLYLTLSTLNPWQLTRAAPAGGRNRFGIYWYLNFPLPPMIGAELPSDEPMDASDTILQWPAASSNSNPHFVSHNLASGKSSQYSALSFEHTSQPSGAPKAREGRNTANPVLIIFVALALKTNNDERMRVALFERFEGRPAGMLATAALLRPLLAVTCLGGAVRRPASM